MVRAGTLRGLAAALALAWAGPAALAEGADDHTQICAGRPDVPSCENLRDLFRRAYPEAFAGDYQAQRNVAYCLEDGCSGAVKRNPTLACAWRMVILLSGSPRVDGTDRSNQRFSCGRLDDLDTMTAGAQAARLRQRISAGQ